MAWMVDHEPSRHAHMLAAPSWVMGAKAETMLRLLQHIQIEHGSVQALLLSLDLGQTTIQRLTNQLVGPRRNADRMTAP